MPGVSKELSGKVACGLPTHALQRSASGFAAHAIARNGTEQMFLKFMAASFFNAVICALSVSILKAGLTTDRSLQPRTWQ